MQIGGRVFVVTGAGNGVGREVALQLLARGARVAGVDLSAEGLADTARQAGTHGTRLTTHAMSVADRAAVAALPEQVLAAHGQVDGVLNIAGIIQRFVHVEDLTLDEIERIMGVNFWGTLYMCHTFIPLLKERPEAALVNVASMGAIVPTPAQGAYAASKGATRMLTETLFAELRGTSVHVSLVLPGGLGTNIAGNSGVDIPESMMKMAGSYKVTPVGEAASAVVDAVATGRFRVLIGSDARMLDTLARVSPTRAITTVADRMSKAMGL